MKRVAVRAELAGTVASVEVAEHDSVEAQQTMLLLESMKMEIPVVAPAAGRVFALRVQPGDSVDFEQVLAILEVNG